MLNGHGDKLGRLLIVATALVGALPALALGVRDNGAAVSSQPQAQSAAEQAPADAQPANDLPAKRRNLLVILEGKALKDHNLKAIGQLLASADYEVTVFVSPTYFLSGDEATAAKLTDFLLEHKDQIKVGVHLSAQRILVENSGVSFRAAPTFWGYPLDVMDCHELCGIEVPLLGYSPKEQSAIIKTAVGTLKSHIGQPIRHSIIEGGLFTKSLAARLRHSGIAVDHTLAGKTAADFYDFRHFPLYSWLDKTGTLARVAERASTCVIQFAHPQAVDGCRIDQQADQVQHLYHSEAFLLTRGTSILLSH